jgi:hypothetical protein
MSLAWFPYFNFNKAGCVHYFDVEAGDSTFFLGKTHRKYQLAQNVPVMNQMSWRIARTHLLSLNSLHSQHVDNSYHLVCLDVRDN